MSADQLARARVEYAAGRAAFEHGAYRQSVQHLEQAVALVSRATQLGGEIQIWLVTAYEAAGQTDAAIALCQAISQHPDLETRKQSRRLQYILEAPKLKTRPEWLTQIPDLGAIAERESTLNQGTASYHQSTRPAAPRPLQLNIDSVDLSQVNTRDNQFVWVALIATILILASLFWLG
ncbi:MAG: hypothetical protein F6K19_29865 [Cyanothece sp. SIO1E1]|nr:hypothetical protein [Cyanothece sp. SIO1E1]